MLMESWWQTKVKGCHPLSKYIDVAVVTAVLLSSPLFSIHAFLSPTIRWDAWDCTLWAVCASFGRLDLNYFPPRDSASSLLCAVCKPSCLLSLPLPECISVLSAAVCVCVLSVLNINVPEKVTCRRWAGTPEAALSAYCWSYNSMYFTLFNNQSENENTHLRSALVNAPLVKDVGYET